MSTKEKTVPRVFIIESLTFENENDGYYEGEVISKILNFNDIEHKYFYIRTELEFIHVIDLFVESNYRYLHISCHGSKNAIATTLERINFKSLGRILENASDRKRLFISACSATNEELANIILSQTDCFSIIGPNRKVDMDDAAIFWASFYHVMFKKNPTHMDREGLVATLKSLVGVFNIPLKYYSTSSRFRKGWTEVNITK